MSAASEAVGERTAKLDERQRRLADRVSGLRTRAGTGTFDRWLLVVGGVTSALGILIVVLGWVGSSQTHVVFEQIPYLISGGLLGIALVFLGTFTYFAYWLTVMVRENRALRTQLASERRDVADQQQEIAATLAEIRDLLAAPRGDEPR